MICRSCGFTNVDTAFYCKVCGTKLGYIDEQIKTSLKLKIENTRAKELEIRVREYLYVVIILFLISLLLRFAYNTNEFNNLDRTIPYVHDVIDTSKILVFPATKLEGIQLNPPNVGNNSDDKYRS